MALPSCGPCVLQYQPARKDVPTGVRVTMIVTVRTTFWLDLRPSPPEGNSVWSKVNSYEGHRP